MVMAAEDRGFLQDLYRDDVLELQSLTGRNLSHWQA